MYLERIILPSSGTEDEILYSSDSPIGTMKGLMKCHSGNLYPFGLFPERSRGMRELVLEFNSPITILYGGNGSGKTTILNLIAESIKAMRHSAFNKSGLFYDYLNSCNTETGEQCRKMMIITSDDVFDYLQRQRRKFEAFNEQRSRFSDEMSRRRTVYKKEAELGKGVSVDFDDPESIESFHKRCAIMKNTNSMLIVKKMGIDQKGQSNGETAIDFFTDQITPGGLYLLDEPENSLSPKMQLALMDFISMMADEFDCQFIIASHSPFFIGMNYASVYNLDADIIDLCDWTELESIQVYRDFFRRLEHTLSRREE
jgi:predicted ATPase